MREGKIATDDSKNVSNVFKLILADFDKNNKGYLEKNEMREFAMKLHSEFDN